MSMHSKAMNPNVWTAQDRPIPLMRMIERSGYTRDTCQDMPTSMLHGIVSVRVGLGTRLQVCDTPIPIVEALLNMGYALECPSFDPDMPAIWRVFCFGGQLYRVEVEHDGHGNECITPYCSYNDAHSLYLRDLDIWTNSIVVCSSSQLAETRVSA